MNYIIQFKNEPEDLVKDLIIPSKYNDGYTYKWADFGNTWHITDTIESSKKVIELLNQIINDDNLALMNCKSNLILVKTIAKEKLKGNEIKLIRINDYI